MRLCFANACVAIIFSFGLAAAEEPESGVDNITKPYTEPDVEGLHWAETFDGDVWTRWSQSKAEKYNGKFEVQRRRKEALVGDVGLAVPEEARHYGAAAKFKALEGRKDTPFVVQFEAKFEDGLTCGGSYIKLFDSGGKEAEEFKDDSPYIIMFGPDRCGGTDKVHFILQHKNPKTGKFEEKHCKEPPSVPQDQLSHLYRLIINGDNSFEIQIDGEKKSSGNLLSSMEPPINPPKEIDDPTDSKPSDWVDEAKMDDPTAAKPDDWDEDAPMQIPDPKASMPAGWQEDAPKQIPDPAAKVPQDWDEDEDGEWEAPIIENPACSVGCGKWEAPRISNPAYKGKWSAPKVDNPAYVGVWKPRQVANPNYFVDEEPCMLPAIDSVGIDIWTMSKGLLFDNIVLSSDLAKATAFAEATWRPRNDIEKLQSPKATGAEGGWWQRLSENLPVVVFTGIALLLATLWCCCLRSGSGSGSTRAEAAAASASAERQEKDKDSAKDTGKDKDGGSATAAAAEPSTAGASASASAGASGAGTSEGGLGDINASDD